MNQIYGFEGEVKAKYTAQMFELFSEVFEWLPLAQCINGKVLVRPRGHWSGVGGAATHPSSHTVFPLPPVLRSCTGACSVRMVSPWTTSGRSSGTGSPLILVRGPGHCQGTVMG